MSGMNSEHFRELDHDIIDDFYFCFRESVDEIEQSFNALDQNYSADELDNLFRAMHSLKGNCRMVFLDPMVTSTHLLEEIVSDLRDGAYAYDRLLGEYILAVIGRLEGMINGLIQGADLDSDELSQLDQDILSLRDATDSDRLEIAERLLNQQLASQAQDQVAKEPEPVKEQPADEAIAAGEACNIDDRQKDLEFFHGLALKLDALSIYKRDPIKEVAQLCLAVNDELEESVNSEQLLAAVYMHDFAMPYIPKRILHLERELRREEAAVFYDHARVAAEFLSRMNCWGEAATMVAQHHERIDGKGHPNQLKAGDIHPGAAIIAVIDCFQTELHQQVDVSPRKNLMKAVNQVNGFIDTCFSAELVHAFNMVIRQRFVKKAQ